MKQAVKDLFDEAGVEINGANPWDIQIKNEAFYARILSEGSIALGESYMDGWWDCEKTDELITKFIRAKLDKKVNKIKNIGWNILKAKIFNQQNKKRALDVGKKHYDAGNGLYKKMLDKRMIYSCGYWRDASNLDEAQENKLDLICKKLELKPDMSLLDIGCGWGGLVKFAVEKYGVKAVGITISKEQAGFAREICKGLDIEIRIQDYRDIDEKFDRVVSVGMFEHVGYKNYRAFFESSNRCLKDDGLLLLHTIGQYRPSKYADPWIEKYIFPNSILPTATQILKASNNMFRFEDWHSFGSDYDRTLMAWHERFNGGWDEIKDNYDERFKKMWNYYLLIFAAGFRSHNILLWQIVFTKVNSHRDYRSIR